MAIERRVQWLGIYNKLIKAMTILTSTNKKFNLGLTSKHIETKVF